MSTEAYPNPPSYEEAIGQLLQNPSAPTIPQPYDSNGLTPRDFDTVNHVQDDDDRDIEDERGYEESRPLKMGRVPDARAQFTFIQPSDTVNRESNNNHGPLSGIRNVFHHQPTYSGVAAGIPTPNPLLHAQPINPAFNAPLAPPSAPPPTSLYAGSELRGPTIYQQHPQPCHMESQFPADKGNGLSATGPSSSGEACSSATMSYAPPTSPPPPRPVTAPITLAGIPDTPGLINAQDVSIANYTRTKRGAESCDKVLEDPYQLYRFFVAHNDRPTMHVLINGHHNECRDSYETDTDGNRKLVTKQTHVDDFKIDIDLTPFISPRGTLYTSPDPKTGKTLTLKEVMEQFAEEENTFKEMHMHKAVAWDYEELTRAITHAIRSVHYRHTIEISYPCTNNLVIVKSSSSLANFMRSGWTKALCFISLVGVIAYPAREIYKKVKDKTLKSEFQMMISTRDFYNQNYWSIVDNVQYNS
ncbi:hypothetical protein EDD21DRAFT_65922 [Dissophora ornata]|nr:hypothetical protein BGZ58_008757 [Dissophora ornata]KAI8602662.1 hypothetical protein EDD21DRAFT_65922 [Dissophora ornata]